MTEQDHVTVNDPRGPVNNGEGHQYVFYGAGVDWMIRKGVESLRIAREDRVRLADRFVAPAGYRVAADHLAKPGSVVLLEAAPGTGRRAAAIMLLHSLGEDQNRSGEWVRSEDQDSSEEGVRFEELPATDVDAEGNIRASGGNDRFLLDLSGIADEEVYAKAQRRLASWRSQVQEAGAHMVVVLPTGMEHAHSPDLEPHTVRLGRPRGLAVITRYLRMDRMAFRPADLGSADLQRLYDRSPMRELARLAGLVRAARDSGRFGTDFAGWLDQAMHAVTDRAGEVGRQVATVRTAPERTLLLTTAVFEEARADTVYEAWHGLMRTVQHEEEAATEFERTDFGERLAALGIERAADGRLRFGRLAYGEAVRTYFWANFPGVRDSLRDWIAHAAGLSGLTTDDRVNVVARFGERSLAIGRPDHLYDLVVRWGDSAAGASCDPRAVAALELGLSDERFGGWFRRRMYDCARSGRLSEGLARVLTTASLRTLGASHPEQAMVRLHYLALRRGKAAAEAGDALLDLASGNRRLYRSLIDRMRNRILQEPPGAESHLRLLTELVDNDRAPDPPPWRHLSLGWKTVFAQPPTKLWTPMVVSWLDAAERDSTRREALGVMVGAARGRAAALHRLYAIAYRWTESARRPSRAAVAAVFWQHIDHAQYAPEESGERADTGPRTTEEA